MIPRSCFLELAVEIHDAGLAELVREHDLTVIGCVDESGGSVVVCPSLYRVLFFEEETNDTDVDPETVSIGRGSV
jgi:hypothetical protein